MASLDLDPNIGNTHGSSFTGIVVTDNGIYLSNGGGRTANERSTYGVVDDQSGIFGGTFYKDVNHDDNEPILYAVSFTTGIAGDFDDDNDVDGIDFLLWQQGESPNPLSASDLADWEANFGTVENAGPAYSQVPESSCLLQCVCIGISSLVIRRLRF